MSTETSQPVPSDPSMDSLDAQLESLLRMSGIDGSAVSNGSGATEGHGVEPAVAAVSTSETTTAIEASGSEVGTPLEAGVSSDGAAKAETTGGTMSVDAVGTTAQAASAPPPPRRPRVSLPVPSSVEDLDAQLASLTESLLAKAAETQAEEAAQRAAAMAAATAPAAEANGAAEGPEADDAETAHSADAGASAQGTPSSAGGSDHSAGHGGASGASQGGHASQQGGHGTGHGGGAGSGHGAGQGHAAGGPSEAAGKQGGAEKLREKLAAAPKVKAAIETAAQIGEKATPMGVKVLAAMNKPLEGKSATLRDSLGWVALWTLFNAVCVWGFVVFFQKPPELAVPHDAPHIASDESASGHGEAKEGGKAHGVATGSEEKGHENASEGHEEKPVEKHEAPAEQSHEHGGH